MMFIQIILYISHYIKERQNRTDVNEPYKEFQAIISTLDMFSFWHFQGGLPQV